MIDSRILKEIAEALQLMEDPIVQRVKEVASKDYTLEQLSLILLVSTVRRLQLKYDKPASYVLQIMFPHAIALRVLIELTKSGFIDNHDRCTCLAEEYDMYALIEPRKKPKY